VPGERILRRGNQVLPLPPKAFETLLLLVRNPGHLMRKEDLMTALWPDSFVEEVSLASKISLLRKVLEEAGAGGAYIQTVPKLGYRFLPAVTRTWASATAAGTPIQAGEQASAVRPAWDPEITFYLARQLARDGAHAEALRIMRELVTEGFFCSTALHCDPWLRPLSRLPDFEEVLRAVLTREAEARTAFEAAGGHDVLA
jgi:DNA-binding winged helix-turn-helix (wHTH) protein